MKPLLLDLFCGAGGCTKGYQMAGFNVIGVDINPQPRYVGDGFVLGDALDVLRRLIDGERVEDNNGCLWQLDDFAVIHASPPCKRDNVMSRGLHQRKRVEYPDLIKPTRKLLRKSGKPYVIENVAGARHKYDSHLMLCGTMFGLQTENGNQLQRHRYFEVFPHVLILQPPCKHNRYSTIGVHGGGQHPLRRKRVYKKASQYDSDVDFGINARRKVMNIEWMTNAEITQAIPPAYTEYIGLHLMATLQLTTE